LCAFSGSYFDVSAKLITAEQSFYKFAHPQSTGLSSLQAGSADEDLHGI
jgi:hypothetical protein